MKKNLSARFTAPKLLTILALVLSLIGLFFVFESSVAEAYATFDNPYHFLQQHAFGLLVGLVLFVTALILPTDFWFKASPVLYVMAIIFLVLVFIPGIGLELNGARRWFSLGPVSFQAIEYVKLGLITYLALWLSKQQKLIPFLVLIGVPTILIILQPDLGSLILLLMIVFGMYFVGGGNFKHLLAVAGVGLPILLGTILLSDYRRARLMTFLNPESDPSGTSFHIRQITLALGRGGWFGQGIGNSSQKYAYIPEVSTDSIFAVIAEEVGFLGSALLILIYFWFLALVFKVAKRQTESRKKLLAFGIFFWIALQAILNLSAVVGLVPLTGIPLPFFSYGRSSQVMVLLATGIIIKLGKEVK